MRPLEYWKGERFLYGRLDKSEYHMMIQIFYILKQIFLSLCIVLLSGLNIVSFRCPIVLSVKTKKLHHVFNYCLIGANSDVDI